MEFLNNVFEQRDKPISDSSKKLYYMTCILKFYLILIINLR